MKLFKVVCNVVRALVKADTGLKFQSFETSGVTVGQHLLERIKARPFTNQKLRKRNFSLCVFFAEGSS